MSRDEQANRLSDHRSGAVAGVLSQRLWDTEAILDEADQKALYDDLVDMSSHRRAAKATAAEVKLSS